MLISIELLQAMEFQACSFNVMSMMVNVLLFLCHVMFGYVTTCRVGWVLFCGISCRYFGVGDALEIAFCF